MASTYWIKLYYEILDDPKMGRLPDHIWRRSIEMFLMAGEAGNGGYLPSVQDIAWRLRTTDADVTECLEALCAVGIADVTPEGDWIVTHFADRQDAPSNAERQQRYRERKQKANYYSNGESNEPRNETVTKRNADIDIDIDKDIDIEAEKNATPATAFPPVAPGGWMMRVFAKVTGMMSIPGNETEKVLPALDGLYVKCGYDESALTEYLKPYWAKWLTTKGKNNQPYKKTNCAWLYEWAVAGEMPSENKPADDWKADVWAATEKWEKDHPNG